MISHTPRACPDRPKTTMPQPKAAAESSDFFSATDCAWRPALRWFSRCSEWLVLAALLLASIPAILIQRDSLTVVPAPVNLVDQSWVLDICYKAARGVWLGRDVLFTYGPLYQWLSSAPSRWIGVSTGTILATANMLPMIAGVLAICAAVRLLLRNASPWRRALLLAVVLWTFPGMRLAICLFAFAVLVQFTEAAALRRRGIFLPGVGAAVLIVSAFLLSADAGLYTATAFVLCVAATAVVNWRKRGAIARLACFISVAVVCLAVLVVANNAVMHAALDFSYWQSSLKLAFGYRWFEPKPMTVPSTTRLLAALALGVIVFAAAWWRRQPEVNRPTSRPAFLLAGFALALVMMQSALVRSDDIHVVNGIYPMVFLTGAILVAAQTKKRWASVLRLAIVVAMAPLITVPYSQSFARAIATLAHDAVNPTRNCPAGEQEFDRACFPAEYAQFFAKTSAYVDEHTTPGEDIVVFPYQNALGVMSRRNVAGGILQSYLVSGDELTRVDLAGIRKADPPFGLYFPEADTSFGIRTPEGIYSYNLDLVPNFSRSPGVWFYLLRHYRSEATPAPGTLALVRDETRDQRLVLHEEAVAEPLGSVPITKRWTHLELGQVHWPAGGADFLKLRFRASYPIWWKVRKPSSLALWVYLADGSEQVLHFFAEPNRDSEIWVYPGDAKDMDGYFASDSSRWPTGATPVRLALWITPFDWTSVTPNSVRIESVEALRISRK